jgi:two-component system response regulator PilR (NtrC family)
MTIKEAVESIGTILVIDDEPDIRKLVALSLSRIGIDTRAAANLAEARELLANYSFDACLCDMRLPDGDGVAFVAELQKDYPHLPVAVITAHGHVESAVEAMRNGAFDFVAKPVDLTVLRRLVSQAIEINKLAQKSPQANRSTNGERRNLATRLRQGERFVGNSPLMQTLRERIKKVARTNAPIWITGESGTGKELIARLIHANGPRAQMPFVAINCGAIPNELVENELFGHLKGSFTGAHQDKEGLFRAANGGTLFLDEVAELPLHMQVKVLRAIQEKAIRPVGSHREDTVDVRLLSASHSDLADRVDDGSFRQDLYYRLNVITVSAPALRDRPEDIPALVTNILNRLHPDSENTVNLDSKAMDRLLNHDFPGNVRELENILARASAMVEGGVISADELELTHEASVQPKNAVAAEDSSLHASEHEPEVARVLDALNETRWNRRKAADLLGLSYRQLRYKIQQLGLDKDDRAA